jgi:hypothetical protein
MSLPISTRGARLSEARPYAGTGWRVVEAQHRVSTLKLVDTLAEQALLEDLLEGSKPVVPPECQHLHYLLATPFRYGAPYPHGSRFRRAGLTPGVFYASETFETAIAELSFCRLLFFAESPRTPYPRNPTEYTGFSVAVRTQSALDLSAPPLNDREEEWTHLSDYAACQAFADEARAQSCEIIRYISVRAPPARNLAILTCAAFAQREPLEQRDFRLQLGAFGARAIGSLPDFALEYPMAFFARDSRLAALVGRPGGP